MTNPNQIEIAPVAGMPATICVGTDRYAATIVSVSKSGHKVVAKYDGRDSEERTFYLGKHGYRSQQSYRLRVGVREDYRDPCF